MDVFDELLGDISPTLETLAGHNQWVAWREQERDGKPTKVPFNPVTLRGAKANDPSTWGTRAQAEAAAARLLKGGRKGGVGIELGSYGDEQMRLGGIDLDSCFDVITGAPEPWAAEVLARFNSYAEISPSDAGIKAFFRYSATDAAKITEKARVSFDRGAHCEMAIDFHSRYYAVTDDRFAGAPSTLHPIPLATLKWFVEEAGPAFLGDNGGRLAKRDESRSGRAFRLAIDIRAAGGDRDAYVLALGADADLAEWSRDDRQVSRTWERAPAPRPPVDEQTAFDEEPIDESIEGFALNEDGVALAFAARFKNRLRYCHSTGKWFEWVGTHWKRDETALAFSWARETCRERARSDPKSAQAKALSKAASSAAVERFARSDRCFSVTAEAWDRDDWLLGTPGGTVELRTGIVRPARPSDMITKVTAVAPIPLNEFEPSRDCPRWLEFLLEASGQDAAAIQFLQQWAGYSLTGDTREEALLFVHGPGGSGKSTAINTLGDLMGDYALNVAAETLTASKFDRHPTELARLKGARMARASETEQGRAWAQQRVKALTGGDTITARFMRQDEFEYRPTFKLTIVGNHAPAIENVDDAMRRRFNVLPFTHRPATVDPTLKDALKAEFAGILSWAIVGALDWQRNGLVRPPIVIEATADYFEQQDTFAAWIDDQCELGRDFAESSANLWASWQSYAHAAGEDAGSQKKTFPERLQQLGFSRIKDTRGVRGRGFRGLRVRDAFEEEQEGPE